MALTITGSLDMPLAETYFLASKARSKLSREANKSDHNLRVLVSHANMLDNLMDSLLKKRKAGSLLTTPTQTTTPSPQKATFGDLPRPEHKVTIVRDDQHDDEEDSEEEEEMYYSSSSDSDYEYDEQDSDIEEEEEFKYVQFTNVKHIPFGSNTNKQFRTLPTVDEAPLEDLHEQQDLHEQGEEEQGLYRTESNVPSLSYSSEEEDEEEDEEDYESDQDESEQQQQPQSTTTTTSSTEMTKVEFRGPVLLEDGSLQLVAA